MKKYSMWIVALLVVGAAVAGVAKMSEQSNRGNQQASSGAFRDGLYLGKRAAERGDPAQVATGRWVTDEDRTQFASGYEQAYSKNSADDLADNTNVLASRAGVAAFRDGLYLGKLDSANGVEPHVAVGRWSNASHRVAFAEGYSQGYKDGDAARTAQNKIHLAQVVR